MLKEGLELKSSLDGLLVNDICGAGQSSRYPFAYAENIDPRYCVSLTYIPVEIDGYVVLCHGTRFPRVFDKKPFHSVPGFSTVFSTTNDSTGRGNRPML
jgi:hypothetical protein